jgi:hypothetical protein
LFCSTCAAKPKKKNKKIPPNWLFFFLTKAEQKVLYRENAAADNS